MKLCLLLLTVLLVSCAPKLTPFQKGNKFGYEDKSGEAAIAPKYVSAREFSEGLAKVGFNVQKIDSFWNEPAFGNEGYWTVNKYPVERFSYIDTKDSILPVALNDGRNFNSGLAAAQLGSKWGYLDKSGEWVISPQYARAFSFEKGKAKVITESKDGKTWYHLTVNKQNKIVQNDPKGKRKPDWFDSLDSWSSMVASGEIYVRLNDYQTAYSYFLAAGRRIDQIEKEDTLGYIKLCTNIASLSAMRVEPENFAKYDALAIKKFEEVVVSTIQRRRIIILEYISYLIELSSIRELNLQKEQEKETLERIVDAVDRSGTEDIKLYWDITDRLEKMK